MILRPGLHRIQAPLGERFIAMYLLEGPDGALLFDTGTTESVEGTLLPYLAHIGFDLDRLRWVISSHCDFDHTGGNAALRAAAPQAEFLAGRADVTMTEDIEALIDGRYGEFAEADGFDYPPETTAFVRASTGLTSVDRALSGGERFDLGDRTIGTSGFSSSNAFAMGSRAASTHTVMVLSASCSTLAKPYSPSTAAVPPAQPARAAMPASAVAVAKIRVWVRRCCAATAIAFLSTSLTKGAARVGGRPIRSYM